MSDEGEIKMWNSRMLSTHETTILGGKTVSGFKAGQSKQVWRSIVKKTRPSFDSRNNNTQKQQLCDSEGCIELHVDDPNHLHRLCAMFPFVCKIGEQTGCGPALLHEVCKERGWKEYQTNCPGSELQGTTQNHGMHWNLWWQYGKTAISSGRSLYPWQMTNFMDHKYNFTDKDVCSRFLTRLLKSYGSGFDFGPMSFNLPNDYPRLCSEHSKRTKKGVVIPIRSNSAGSNRRPHFRDTSRHSTEPIWICKPVGKSRGRGITVFDTVTKISYHTQSVVQEYISRPYLIGGYKWDLRIYVCIVSTSPLVVYAYREGIVRFATDLFTLKNLYNPYAHLTNTSLNKGSPSYRHPKEVIGVGCKWTLRKLRGYWVDNNVKDWYLWQRILKILILTVVGDADNISNMPNSSKTFSLFGFDIMVDSNMKPYLLEVNKNPALGHDCEVDVIVKKPMLHDLFDLLGLPNIRHFEGNSDATSTSVNSTWENSLDSFPSYGGNYNKENVDGVSPGRTFGSAGKAFRCESDDKSWCKAPLSNSLSGNENVYESNGGIRKQSDLSYRSQIGTNPFFSVTGFPGDRRLEPPLIVKIPIQKKVGKQKLKCGTEGLAGLVLGIRNWQGISPPEVGNWTRIFPFDSDTENDSKGGSEFDIRRVMNHMSNYLRTAKELLRTQGTKNYRELDIALQKAQNLTVPVWHPPYNSTQKNTSLLNTRSKIDNKVET